MTNQELIRQYVDTGVGIPEYQFNKLSGNLKKTYVRKRLIAFEGKSEVMAPYEMEFIPQVKKERYRDEARKLYFENKEVSPFLFCFLNPEEQRVTFEDDFKKNGLTLDRNTFEMMDPKNKSHYVKMLYWSHRKLSDFEFDWLDDNSRKTYVSRQIGEKQFLSDHQYLYASPDQRKEYLSAIIKNSYYTPTKMQWDLLDSEQKKNFAILKVQSKRPINDEEFDSIPDDRKQSAVWHLVDNQRTITPLQFGYLDDGRKRFYIFGVMNHGFNIPGKEYTDQLNPETKAEYEAALKKRWPNR